jgi:hypothetical protein
MTIVLQWWWGLPLVIAFGSLMRDLFEAAWRWLDFPWSLLAWPLFLVRQTVASSRSAERTSER